MWAFSLLFVAVFATGCSCCDPPDPVRPCKYEALEDASVGPIVDAIDAGPVPDAMPRAADPAPSQCVAAWEGGNCDDANEPNNGMIAAKYLKQCTSAGLDGSSGYADVDVYRTGDCEFGKKVALGPLMPWAQLDPKDSSEDLSALRVCVFPTCGSGATNVYACIETDGDVTATTDMPSNTNDLWRNDVGFRGCCRTGKGRITVRADCPLRSTTIDTYVWVEPASHDSDPGCVAYTLKYNAQCTPPNCPW